MAMRENGSFFRVSHFGDVGKKMKAAQDLMKDVTGQLRSLEEKMDILAQRKMDKASFLAVMDKLFPPSEAELAQRSASQKAANTARDNKLAEIAGLYESNDKGAIPEIKGTAYNLLNAVIEYTDHYAGTDASRARSAMFRTGCRPEARGPRRDSGNDRRQSGHPAHRIEADEAAGTGAEQDADRHRGRNVRRRDREGPQQASALELTPSTRRAVGNGCAAFTVYDGPTGDLK